jgi:Protein of unknown function (DUF3455)
MRPTLPALAALVVLILPLSAAARAEVPDAVIAPGQALVATLHAEGAQVYECKADASGKLAWQFREPIATLIGGSRTVGRHYAGPTWELVDGSAVVGKVAGRAPGATPNDIPLLRLESRSRRAAASSAASGRSSASTPRVAPQRDRASGPGRCSACPTRPITPST